MMGPAQPNFPQLTPEELASLSPEDREHAARVDECRHAIAAAVEKMGAEAPRASANYMLAVLGHAREAMQRPDNERGYAAAMAATNKAMDRIRQASGAFALETLVELGALTETQMQEIRDAINAAHTKAVLKAVTPSES